MQMYNIDDAFVVTYSFLLPFRNFGGVLVTNVLRIYLDECVTP